MTDVLERRDLQPTVTTGARLLLASLSAGAGAIHLAMVPSHWSESVVDGVGFAVVGWLQLAFAVAIVSRPSRDLLRLAILLNYAAIVTWAVSRTIGLPYGGHAGVAEDAGFVDITCVAFEVALVIACTGRLFRPALAARFARGGLAVAGIATLGVLALTTATLASPGALNHGHSDGDVAAAGGHSHSDGATARGIDDKGLSLLHNGQHDHATMLHTLDAPTQEVLDDQLAVTRDLAAQMPTVAAAIAAGYQRVGPYFPGIGAHFMKPIGARGGGGFSATTLNSDGILDDVDLHNPLMLIFDGTKQTSKIAGFMYYSMSGSEPAGFAGRNDSWHYHEQLCLKYTSEGIDVPYGLDNSATPAQCAKVGGRILEASQYMVHVWSVPGFEMTKKYGGVFGEVNPKLDCADGTYYQLPIDQWAAHPLNVCKEQ